MTSTKYMFYCMMISNAYLLYDLLVCVFLM